MTLIGVLGAWLFAQIGKSEKLRGIGAATNQVISAAQLTVGELQQTIVDKWKTEGVDGKLNADQIDSLGRALYDKTIDKLSAPALTLLASARVDINALITGAGEAWINAIKESQRGGAA